MKHIFALLLLVVCSTSTLAQTATSGQLTGSLTDSTTTKPVPFATVALMNASQLILGTTSDDKGAFTLPNIAFGTYTLTISFVGYRTKTIPITLTADQPTSALGVINLTTEGKTLNEVVVAGQKALVEDKGDRLVYNAEKDVSNTGGTAADVLRKVPSLSVDLNGNVQIRGNSNLRVLLNGKPSAMMARNLADALRQMPANIIKSVEVITSPGAKYDAEGSAGVINIITKKALSGINGSVNATAGNFNRGLGTSLNIRGKKVGLSLSANGYQYRNIRESESIRTTLSNGQPLNVLTQASSGDNTGTGGYGEMSVDYDPDTTSRINLAANVWGGAFPNNSVTYNRLTDPAGNELQAFRTDSRFRNPYGNGQLDLGYTRTFRKRAGAESAPEFSLLTQFSRMPDNYFYESDRYSPASELIVRQRSTNYSRNKEYTLQTDYTYPFRLTRSKDTTQFKLEVGAKAIVRDIGSEYRVEQTASLASELIADPAQSNDFTYLQKVYSGYASLRIDTKNKWALNAGVRLEHTDIRGEFLTTQTSLQNQYTNLIPSVTLSKGVKTHTLKVSYTQRIQRPLIWYLNPWLNASDPKNLQTGNPYLNPELNHALELAHNVTTKKGLSINTALYWRMTNNAIEYLTTVDTAGVSLSRPLNIARRQNYGLNLNLAGQPNKNWNLSGGSDLRYVRLNSPALNQRNQGFIWEVNLNSTYKLPHDFTLQANGSYSTGWISLQGTNTGFYWYGVAAKREFIKKMASLTLGVNNPFSRGIAQTGQQSAPTFESSTHSFFVNRSVRLTFEWRFGQMNKGSNKQTKKISNDDRSR